MSNARALTTSDKLFYSIGQLAESMKNLSLAVFILFYNNLLGMSAMLAGLSMLLTIETAHAFRNRNFRWYFTGAVMICMVISIDTALLLYVNTYMEISGRPLLWVSLSLFVGYFRSQPEEGGSAHGYEVANAGQSLTGLAPRSS